MARLYINKKHIVSVGIKDSWTGEGEEIEILTVGGEKFTGIAYEDEYKQVLKQILDSDDFVDTGKNGLDLEMRG